MEPTQMRNVWSPWLATKLRLFIEPNMVYIPETCLPLSMSGDLNPIAYFSYNTYLFNYNTYMSKDGSFLPYFVSKPLVSGPCGRMTSEVVF